MQRLLILAGLLLLTAGLLWPWISQLPLGRLPGDIAFQRGGAKVYVPVVICIVLSVVLTLLFRLFGGR